MIELLAHQHLTDHHVWTLMYDLHYTHIPADDDSPTLAFGAVFGVAPTPDAQVPQKMIVPIRHRDDYLGSVWVETVIAADVSALLGYPPTLHRARRVTFGDLAALEHVRPGSRVVVGVPVGDADGTLRIVYDQPFAVVVRAAP